MCDRYPTMKNVQKCPESHLGYRNLLRSQGVTNVRTTINVSKCPDIIMQVSNDKLLIWRLHWVILKRTRVSININTSISTLLLNFNSQQHLTNCGNSFSAALRGTEKPPCVLVSLAVKFLQKNSVGCLLFVCPRSGIGKTSLSWMKGKEKCKDNKHNNFKTPKNIIDDLPYCKGTLKGQLLFQWHVRYKLSTYY